MRQSLLLLTVLQIDDPGTGTATDPPLVSTVSTGDWCPGVLCVRSTRPRPRRPGERVGGPVGRGVTGRERGSPDKTSTPVKDGEERGGDWSVTVVGAVSVHRSWDSRPCLGPRPLALCFLEYLAPGGNDKVQLSSTRGSLSPCPPRTHSCPFSSLSAPPVPPTPPLLSPSTQPRPSAPMSSETPNVRLPYPGSHDPRRPRGPTDVPDSGALSLSTRRRSLSEGRHRHGYVWD